MEPPSSTGPLKPEMEDGGAALLYAVDGGVSWWVGMMNNGGFTVGAGDHNVEVVSPLTGVSCFLDRHRDTPEGALEVGCAGWVGAGCGWVEGWVSLDVYVERNASLGLVAEGGTCECIVASECVQAHVVGRTHGATLIREDLSVPIWFGGASGKCLGFC